MFSEFLRMVPNVNRSWVYFLTFMCIVIIQLLKQDDWATPATAVTNVSQGIRWGLGEEKHQVGWSAPEQDGKRWLQYICWETWSQILPKHVIALGMIQPKSVICPLYPCNTIKERAACTLWDGEPWQFYPRWDESFHAHVDSRRFHLSRKWPTGYPVCLASDLYSVKNPHVE